MRKPLISIVICTFNRGHTLKEALNSIIYQKTYGRFKFEIILVDNGSTDNTKKIYNNFLSKNQNDNLRYI